MPSPRAQGLIAVNCAAVLFGTAALFGKLALSPFWIVGARACFAALALFLLARLRRRFLKPPRAAWPILFATGLLLCVHWLSFFASVQMGGVAVATLTFACFPLFTVLTLNLLKRERPHLTEWLAGFAILLAVALIFHAPATGGRMLPGIFYGILSALLFAWFGLASKRLGATLPRETVSLMQNLLVAMLLLPCLPFAGRAPVGQEWGWLLLMALMTTVLMHQLYFFALERLGAASCSGFIALEPVYAILFARLLFGDPLPPVLLVSGALILASSYALLRMETRATPGIASEPAL